MPTVDFGQIFELAHDAVLILDLAEERVLDANRRACEMYGFERDQLIGRSMVELTLEPQSGVDHVRLALEAAGCYSFETVQRRRDGSSMVLEINASVVDYAGQRAILSINRDVTQRKQQEEELARHREQLHALVQDRTSRLEEVNEQLQGKIRELERFVYTVSHDLRSPLTTISGFLGLLRRDAAAGNAERMQHDMERIRSAVGTMANLLDDLLRISRAGKMLSGERPVPLREPAHKAVALAVARFDQTAVEVIIEPDLPTWQGDPARLQQVFQNLVENAVKFMGDQSDPRIRIATRRDRDETVVFVEDNGIGIEPADQVRIFDLFERLHCDAGGGSGVGLAVVQRIIEAHGGRVWVESAGSGQGSTFCFVLPDRQVGAEGLGS